MNLDVGRLVFTRNGSLVVFRDQTERYPGLNPEYIMDTNSAKVRDSLVELGWTPPGEKAKVRLTEDQIGEARHLMSKYNDLTNAHPGTVVHIPYPFRDGGTFKLALSEAEIIASIDRQKKEAQDALAKLGIEYP